MVVAAFFSWWYGAGWRQVLTLVPITARKLDDALSMRILARTLFYPWRRIVSYGTKGFGSRFQAMIDNAISRVVGGIVRSVVLVAGLIALLVSSIGVLIFVMAWPLLPVLPIILLAAEVAL